MDGTMIVDGDMTAKSHCTCSISQLWACKCVFMPPVHPRPQGQWLYMIALLWIGLLMVLKPLHEVQIVIITEITVITE